MSARPIVIAHGGNAGEAPENTAASFQQAVDLGVDVVELDANRTSDGVPVVWHGPDLGHAGRPDALIHELTLAESRELDIGAWRGEAFRGQRLLTLSETLDLLKGHVSVAVDLKAFGAIPAVARCVMDAGMADNVQICGCNVAAARAVRKCGPKLAVGLNTDASLARLASEDHGAFCRAYVDRAVHDHLAPLNVSQRYVTPQLIHLAKLRAVPVWAWTVDDPEDMLRMIDLGVDAIYSNYPGQLLDLLDQPAGR